VSDFLIAAYPWIKALHIVSVVAWMAGLLYLPRLFVYHAEAEMGSDKAETFKIMERRLLRGIMAPALILVVLFGALLTATPGVVDWHQGWIWAKLVLVAGLIVFHHLLAYWRKSFAADAVPHTARFFRLVNELPMIALIVIAVLVVVKPF
jgi:protoporphyrinogen IX oxidase